MQETSARVTDKTTRMKPKMAWRWWDGRNARNIGYLWGKAVDIK